MTRALDSYQLDTPLTAVAGSAVAASDLPQAAAPQLALPSSLSSLCLRL